LVAPGEDADRFAGRLGGDCVAVAESGLILAFVPDPDGPGRQAQLAAALGDEVAVIGPTVALDRSHLSLARARAAEALVDEGVIGADGPIVRAEQHLVELMLHGDPALTGEIAARALAPLDDLKPGTRDRLTVTLRAWLDNPGQISRIAETLHVHPQTVRYRVGQLRELFGERLEDPDSRFELQLAVRSAVRR
jgi:sugar diacid utilization regulator